MILHKSDLEHNTNRNMNVESPSFSPPWLGNSSSSPNQTVSDWSKPLNQSTWDKSQPSKNNKPNRKNKSKGKTNKDNTKNKSNGKPTNNKSNDKSKGNPNNNRSNCKSNKNKSKEKPTNDKSKEKPNNNKSNDKSKEKPTNVKSKEKPTNSNEKLSSPDIQTQAFGGKVAITYDENYRKEFDYKMECYDEPESERERAIMMKNLGYPYHPLCRFSPRVFTLYMKNGDLGDKDFQIDIPYIFENFISGELDSNWEVFISKLSLSNVDYQIRELYLDKVTHYDRMIEAYKLGFKDSRLERAIVNMQRLLRGQKPNISSDIPGGVKLNSIAQIKYATSDNADENIFHWNPHLIPEYIFDHIYNGQPYVLTQLMIEGIDMGELKQRRVERITKYLPEKLTEDFYSKFYLVSQHYLANQLSAFRCYDRDVLKFLQITRDDWDEKKSRDYLLRDINKYKETDLQIIIHFVEKSLSSSGRELINEFVKLDIDILSTDILKKWFVEIMLEPLNSYTYDHHLLHRFLRNEINDEIIIKYKNIVEFLKRTLKERQDKIRDRSYVYKVNWSFYKPTITYIIYL